MMRPTRVTICELNRLFVETADKGEFSQLLILGFKKDELNDHLYAFKSDEPRDVFDRIERLRDLGFPFSTHRHGGADHAVEIMREKGFVSGSFLRVNFDDWEPDAPYNYQTF